jgi:hypothetical protein
MATTKKAIRQALDKYEEKLMHENGDSKLTLAEYVKLLQVSQELADEEPKEIKVSWVENEQKSEEA